MVASRTPTLMTAEELERLPDNGTHYELVKGELVEMAPPGGEHGGLAIDIGGPLNAHVKQNKLGRVLVETGYKLARNPDVVRSPDVSFLRRQRIPASGLPRGYIDGSPDLAVEIVSPGDTAEEIEAKVQDYLTYGTRLVWVVQPKTRTVTAYYSDGRARVLREKDALDGEDVVPGFTLALTDLWG